MAQVHTQRSSIQGAERLHGGATTLPGAARRLPCAVPEPLPSGQHFRSGSSGSSSSSGDAGYQVERAFLPGMSVVDAMEKGPCSTVDTYETELDRSGHFPTIGVSLAYELELAGLIEALKLAGIPPLRRDRGPEHPRIVMGGPLTFSNPLPAAPFVDAMIMGEAEDVLLPAFEAAVHTEGPAWLDEIAALEGGYVPDIHGERLPAVAKASDARLPAFAPIMAPDAELSDMFLIEGERGCHRMCSFCVMRRSTNGGMRLVSPDCIITFVPEAQPASAWWVWRSPTIPSWSVCSTPSSPAGAVSASACPEPIVWRGSRTSPGCCEQGLQDPDRGLRRGLPASTSRHQRGHKRESPHRVREAGGRALVQGHEGLRWWGSLARLMKTSMS